MSILSDLLKTVASSVGKTAVKKAPGILRGVGRNVDELPFSKVPKEVVKQIAGTRTERLAATKAAAVARRGSKEIGPIRYGIGQVMARTSVPQKLALGGLLGVGTYATVGRLTKEDKPENISVEDWKDILATTNAAGSTAGQDDYYKALEEAARARAGFMPQYPGSDALAPQSNLSAQYGASTAAAMDALAQQYAQTAGGIKQRGNAAAATVNDIYGQGASAMDALATAPSDGMSGMIPVSGEEALAGQYSQAQGQSMADYLRANQLIDAQAAGELAGYTQLLGPAYQSQYNLMDLQARQAADYQKAMRLADFQANQQAQLQDDLGQIAMQRATDTRAASSYSANPATLAQYVSEWELLDDAVKSIYEAQGITNAAQFVKNRIAQDRRAALGF